MHMFIVHFYTCKFIHSSVEGVKSFGLPTFKCVDSNMKENIKLFTIPVG